MKTGIAVTTLALMLTAFTSVASGQTKVSDEKIPDRIVEVETAISAGGPLLLAFTGYDEMIAAPATGALDVRLGLPKWSFMRLEVSTVLTHGVGANLIMDWIRIGRRVRIHLIDPGVFYIFPRISPGLSVTNIPRKYDVTFGGGIDIRLNRHFGIGLNWRAYAPDACEVGVRYGNFAKVIYSEAIKGGQLWVRFTYYAW